MDARGGSGAQHGAAQHSAAHPLSGKGRLPYVKLCGLRLPDTLTPGVDEPHEAQVGPVAEVLWHDIGLPERQHHCKDLRRRMGSIVLLSWMQG